MNLLFYKKIRYNFFESIDNVEAKLESIIDRKWHDLTNNLSGKRKADKSFILWQKWRIMSIGRFHSDAIMKVELQETEKKNVANIIIRPSFIPILFFYFLVIWALYELLPIHGVVRNHLEIKLIVFVFFILLLLGIIKLSMYNLQKSFERFMGV